MQKHDSIIILSNCNFRPKNHLTKPLYGCLELYIQSGSGNFHKAFKIFRSIIFTQLPIVILYPKCIVSSLRYLVECTRK